MPGHFTAIRSAAIEDGRLGLRRLFRDISEDETEGEARLRWYVASAQCSKLRADCLSRTRNGPIGENMPRYLEDFEIGETWTGDPIEVTEDDITTFARQYDPQPIHTDPQVAAQSRFCGVIASGWHVVALTMRAFIQGGGHRGTPAVGLGVDELRWRKPVRPGDVLSVTREVVGVDRSRSRPEFGTVRTRVSVTNQNGDVVLTMVSIG